MNISPIKAVSPLFLTQHYPFNQKLKKISNLQSS